ncbi:MAG TPA: phosphoribosylformylglycinamidine synthase subunit PurL [Acidimicrobiales bacterium]|nr:phosphoribosylformylglycinamidine synthase subunit PurL [Acidimicrobiales bacterium]
MDEQPLHRALGLTDDELEKIKQILERDPSRLELSMYSVMWSEHCSYKSSKIHLRRLPTEAPWVICGPGENAGVIDGGDGVAVALRIESHNHPSAVEPYQGAATGVGGILRDIFTMGARPIATLDPLRFGTLDEPRNRWICEGVVAGVSGYGNAVGVPTVGGELVFDPTYADNPLVNVMCVGLLPKDDLVLATASGVGNLAVLLGSSTGRDGIGGASVLASAGFGEAEEEAAKRPSVQVGDPFEEKRLIEACLDIIRAGLVVGIQDLGAAGLTGATSETSSNAGLGLDVHLDRVPQREPNMEPFEIMTSESQERMLAFVKPEHLDEVLAIAEKWEVRHAVIGEVNSSGRLRVLSSLGGTVEADIPAASLSESAPLYERPMAEPPERAAQLDDDPAALPAPDDATVDLLAMLYDPAWAYRQYDHQLFLNTVAGPGADAAVLRLAAPGVPTSGTRGIAVTTDGNHRWCAADPRRGAAMVVAESTLNIACVGAEPKAVVNCLNFGNPEHPEVMWQFSETIDGMSEACRALKTPVVGGNVSFYNESRGANIDPTPVIGAIGLIDKLDRRPPGAVLVPGARVVLVGPRSDVLTASLWARARHDHVGGRLAPLDLDLHNEIVGFVASVVRDALVAGAHDVADGGLGLAVAEMAIAGECGAQLDGIDGHGELFSEAPSRVLLVVDDDHLQEFEDRLEDAGLPFVHLGVCNGDRLFIGGSNLLPLVDVAVDDLAAARSTAMPTALAAGTAH